MESVASTWSEFKGMRAPLLPFPIFDALFVFSSTPMPCAHPKGISVAAAAAPFIFAFFLSVIGWAPVVVRRISSTGGPNLLASQSRYASSSARASERPIIPPHTCARGRSLTASHPFLPLWFFHVPFFPLNPRPLSFLLLLSCPSTHWLRLALILSRSLLLTLSQDRGGDQPPQKPVPRSSENPFNVGVRGSLRWTSRPLSQRNPPLRSGNPAVACRSTTA